MKWGMKGTTEAEKSQEMTRLREKGRIRKQNERRKEEKKKKESTQKRNWQIFISVSYFLSKFCIF